MDGIANAMQICVSKIEFYPFVEHFLEWIQNSKTFKFVWKLKRREIKKLNFVSCKGNIFDDVTARAAKRNGGTCYTNPKIEKRGKRKDNNLFFSLEKLH